MDCLRSFNFGLSRQANFGAVDGFVSWTIGTDNFFNLELTTATPSKYIIEGFKNINIYKIEVIGEITSTPQNPPFNCIVQNWTVGVRIEGLNSSNAGFVDSVANPFVMFTQPRSPFVRLSKFNPLMEFQSPITSAKTILITNIFVEGIANQSVISAQINYNLNFTVYYNYEGE